MLWQLFTFLDHLLDHLNILTAIFTKLLLLFDWTQPLFHLNFLFSFFCKLIHIKILLLPIIIVPPVLIVMLMTSIIWSVPLIPPSISSIIIIISMVISIRRKIGFNIIFKKDRRIRILPIEIIPIPWIPLLMMTIIPVIMFIGNMHNMSSLVLKDRSINFFLSYLSWPI